jgi:hypothetical protein
MTTASEVEARSPPIEASKAAVCYVRNTSTPAVGGLPLEGQESTEAVDPMRRLGFDASCH